MKMTWLKWLGAGLLLGAMAGCGGQKREAPAGGVDQPGTEGPAAYEIAVIPKGTVHDFWKAVHAGAAKAASELGVEIIWMGPESEGDRKQQIDVVQSFISRGVDAIVLAPLDEVALVRPTETAVQRGIPVVIFDSALKSEAQSSFVATDNVMGGRLGARRLAEVMGGKGKAILLRYEEGSASTENRERGFLEEMREAFPGIELVSTDQYGGVSKESAFKAAQNLLNKYGDDIQGAFCPNESTAFGMMRALQTSGRAGKIRFVGFDSSQGLLDGLAAGTIDGLVVQDPFDMGYTGVQNAVAVLKGESVPARVATNLKVVTPENTDDPEIQALIKPDLDAWLKP